MNTKHNTPHTPPGRQATRWSLPRRRFLGIGAGALAAALTGCGGGGDDTAPVIVPTDPFGGEAPAGFFGGGQGRVAYMATPSTFVLFDLASRTTLSSFSIGTESADGGVTASPDGTIALLSHTLFDNSAVVRVLRADASVLYEYAIAYGLVGVPQTAAVISADGQRLAFSAVGRDTASGNNVWRICVIDIDGFDLRTLEYGRFSSSVSTERANPVWLDDGRLLVLTDEQQLLADIDFTALTPLSTQFLVEPGRASYDRLGNRMLFDQVTPDPDPNAHVWSQDLATGVQRQLTASVDFDQYSGAVSPDGAWLMYVDLTNVLVNGAPTTAVGTFLSVLPLTDQTVDVSDRDLALRDAVGQPVALEPGLIGWF